MTRNITRDSMSSALLVSRISPNHVITKRNWKAQSSQAQTGEESMPEHMVQRGKRGVWYADCRYKGVRIRKNLGTTDRRHAERELAKIKADVEGGDYQNCRKRFDELALEYTQNLLSRKSEHSKERYGKIVKVHLIPFFADKCLGEIDQNMVVEYKLCREQSGAKPSTLKKELRVLKDILRVGRKDFELPTVKEFPLMKWGNKPKVFDKSMILEESDVLRIVDYVQKKNRSICLIAIYSGLRLSDIVSLCRKEVDITEGWIRKYQGKTEHWVEIPVCQKLKDILDSLPSPLENTQSYFSDVKTKAISTEIRRACKRAGYQGHSFKSFRHFAATFLVNAGVPIEVIKDFMGHQNISTTMIYAKVKADTLKKAGSAFDQSGVSTKCPQAGNI